MENIICYSQWLLCSLLGLIIPGSRWHHGRTAEIRVWVPHCLHVFCGDRVVVYMAALSLHVLETRGKTSESCCEKALCKLGHAVFMSLAFSAGSFSSPIIAAVVVTAVIIVPIVVTSLCEALSLIPSTALWSNRLWFPCYSVRHGVSNSVQGHAAGEPRSWVQT